MLKEVVCASFKCVTLLLHIGRTLADVGALPMSAVCGMWQLLALQELPPPSCVMLHLLHASRRWTQMHSCKCCQ